MKSVILDVVTAAWLLAIIGAGRPCTARVVSATDGRGIVLGFITPDVTTVVVLNDVSWVDADWDGIETPLPMTRSLTVTGLPPGPDGLLLTWDSNYVSRKVRLVNVTLTLQNFAIYRYRRVNQNLAPGCDVLAPCAAGDWGRVVLDNAFLVQRLCYPPSMHLSALAGVARPLAIPGNQSYRVMLPQPACAAPPAAAPLALPDSEPRPQEKCWPYMGAYDDLGIFCADLDTSQKQLVTGYTLHCRKVLYVCDDMISDECVARLGTLGCYNNWAAYKQQLTSQSPAGTAGTAPPSSTSSGHNTAAVVGGVVGGVCGAILVGVAVGAFLWRRRQRQNSLAQHPGGDAGGAKDPSAGPYLVAVADSSHDDVSAGGLGGAGAHGACAACWPLGVWAQRQEALANLAGGGVDPEYGGAPGAVALVRDHSSGTGIGGSKAGLLEHPDAAGGGRGSADSKTDQAQVAAPLSGGASDQNGEARRGPQLQHHLLRPHSNSNGGGPHEHQQGALAEHLTTETLTTCAFETATGTDFTAYGGSLNADGALATGTATASAAASSSVGLDAVPPSPLLMSTVGGLDTMDVVTLDTPLLVTVSADPRVKLLPVMLGRGAFGRVLEGRYQGQRVAVKILNEVMGAADHTKHEGHGGAQVDPNIGAVHRTSGDCSGDAGGDGGDGQAIAMPGGTGNVLEALAKEVEVLGRCRHPNVVRLLAACLTPPRLCLVMELMETSLERMLYGGGSDQPLLPLGTVLDIALDVAQGLSYLHPTIVHRDLKPGNVLVNLNGGKRPLAKLSDFGLSRIQSTVAITADLEAGTPGYMAPELFDVSNFVISHKVDMYSYGVLLWAMLTGKEPWKEYGLVQMTYCVAILQQRPPLPGPERCSDKMRRLINSCWEPQPQRRPAAAEVVKQLLLIKQYETFASASP